MRFSCFRLQWVFCCCYLLLAASVVAQEPITLKEWEMEAQTNIRMRPRYGDVQKTAQQKAADEKFVRATLAMDRYRGDSIKASKALVDIGFEYLAKKDVRTAMYRFNQAYLLWPQNADIYWGYGAVYMTLGDLEHAQEQYKSGLDIDSNHTLLLTDYASYFMVQYTALAAQNQERAWAHLSSAIKYLNKSYALDPRNSNTVYKLAVCHLMNEDCTKARSFYNACMKLGGREVSDDFFKTLTQKCP